MNILMTRHSPRSARLSAARRRRLGIGSHGATRSAPRNALPSIEEVAEALGGRPPGPEEIFGRQVLLDELRGKIGRDEDTNANLTRRMLLMLESVAICG